MKAWKKPDADGAGAAAAVEALVHQKDPGARLAGPYGRAGGRDTAAHDQNVGGVFMHGGGGQNAAVPSVRPSRRASLAGSSDR